MQDSGYPAENAEQNVEEDMTAAAFPQDHGERWEEDGYDAED